MHATKNRKSSAIGSCPPLVAFELLPAPCAQKVCSNFSFPLLWRWSIVWLPMGGLLFAALGLLEKSGTLALLGVMGSVLGVMALALVAGVLAYSILHPSCGVADRLAGTRLAPK